MHRLHGCPLVWMGMILGGALTPHAKRPRLTLPTGDRCARPGFR
ncbi:Hypothetical protein AA314_09064 [Archangium gephyra]|uniref:Uncharacterized protein n=1 Tax=Archangium gephyra TaxID=48 RepID=A0AAC8TIM1_9BACT|nr:Hypothetical protein AA314_09064 [Archangium gephyra]